jgi:hypothetical protein
VTTLTTALGPGTARLAGTVSGPDGPVQGATVRVERLLGDAPTATTLTTGPGGQWALDAINGGRYRVRAWRPPDLAQLRPVVFFLGATEARTVTLTLARYGDENAVATVKPDPPVVDQPATVVVGISSGGIDANGVLHASPRPGVSVQLVATAGLVLDSPDTAVTDGAGNASFSVHCVKGPAPAAQAVVAGNPHRLELPACAPAR